MLIAARLNSSSMDRNLSRLSRTASEALIKFGSKLNTSGGRELQLNGLETISPHLAQSIEKIERGCGLMMNSVRELPVEFADVLAAMTKKKWHNQIRLEGLDSVSKEAATSLAKTKLDQLYLNVSRLAEEVIHILEKCSNLNLTTDSGWYGGDED